MIAAARTRLAPLAEDTVDERPPMSTNEPTGHAPATQSEPQPPSHSQAAAAAAAQPKGAAGAAGSSAQPEPAWQRRRRLDAIFGETLPSQTSDDIDADSADRSQASNDAWLRAQVPPHHGAR